MTDTFHAPSATPLSLARWRIMLVACLLAFASQTQAQTIIQTLSEDVCIPSPEDGIFCGEDHNPFPVRFENTIRGERTESWYVYSIPPYFFNYNHYGHSEVFYAYTLAADSRLTVEGSGQMHYRGTIDGPGSFRLLAGGSLMFDRSGTHVWGENFSRNTYSGGTEIAGGWLKIYDDASLGSGALTLSDGGRLQTLDAGSLRGFTLLGDDNVIQADYDLSIDGVISGDGRLNKHGAGTVTLTQDNTYAGGTHVAEGALAVSTDTNLGAADTRVSLANNTTLSLGDAFASSLRELELQGASAQVSVATGNATWNGATAGSGQLVKQGAGTLTLAGGIGHTGGADIAAGTLEVSVSAILGGTGSTSWSGPITGSGAFVKSGAGTLVLSGAATHSGATVVRGGTLQTAAANVLSANSALFLIGGATLNLAGHDQTVGDLDSYNVATQQVEASTVVLGGATLTSLTRVINLWAGSLTGSGTLVKQGAAEMKWYAANSFSGEFRIEAGTASAQAADVFSPNATVTVASGATLQLNGYAQTLAGLSGAGAVSLGYATLTLNQTSDTTFAGVISGGGGLTKSGRGALTLTGTNTYTGFTQITEGAATFTGALPSGLFEIAAGAQLAFSADTVDLTRFSGAGTVTSNAAFTSTSAVPHTFNLSFAGSGALTHTGAGILYLGGTNTFTGDTTVRQGTLQTSRADALSSASTLRLLDGATFNLNGQNQTVGDLDSRDPSNGNSSTSTVALGGATFTVLNRTDTHWAGALTGSGTFIKQGTAEMNWSGANTFTGTLRLDAGTLHARAADTLSANATVQIASAARLALNDFSQTIAGLSGSGAVALGSATLTVNQAAHTTFSGALSGSGGLTKSGSGSLTLSSDNTYSGTTTLAAGTLIVNGSLATSDLIAHRDTALRGSGTIDGLTTIMDGAVLAPGNSPGTLTFAGGLTLNDGAILNFELGTSSDLIRVTGGTLTGAASDGGITLNLSDSGGFTAASYTLFDFSGATTSSFDVSDFIFGNTIAGYTYQLALIGSTLQLTAIAASAVPEPSTYAALLGACALGLALIRRRKR